MRTSAQDTDTNACSPTTAAADLAAELLPVVLAVLERRAEALRSRLPARPARSGERLAWWKSLTGTQPRQGALLEFLEVMCGHLRGIPAPGWDAGEPLPAGALEEAEGFVDADTAFKIAEYRFRATPGRVVPR